MRIAHHTTPLLLVAAALLLLAAPLAGQRAGDRIRVSLAGDRLVGRVGETTETGFVLNIEGGSAREVTHREIELLERSLGRRTYKKLGFLIGAGAGVGIGTALGLIVSDLCDEGDADCGAGLGAAVGILGSLYYGGGLGLIGLGIGHLIKGENWEPIDGMRMGLGIRPQQPGTLPRLLIGSHISF